MKQAVIYSCHLEERENEPDNELQIALCKEYAERNGIEIVGNYMDRVSTKKEPLLMKRLLLQECRKKHWNLVLIASMSILGRNIKETMKFLTELSKYVDYKIVDKENDELLNEIGELLITLYKESRL